MESLVVHVCYGTGQPFIFEERGAAKTEKHNHAQEKKEKKNSYTRKYAKKFMQVSPILGICITEILEKKFSYFEFLQKFIRLVKFISRFKSS